MNHWFSQHQKIWHQIQKHLCNLFRQNVRVFNYEYSILHQNRWRMHQFNRSSAFEQFANVAIKSSISKTSFTSIYVNIMLESLSKTQIFEFRHSNLHTKSQRNQQSLAHLLRNSLNLFFLQHHEVRYSQRKCFRDLFHLEIRISRLRHSKSHQNRWRNYQSIARLLFRSRLLELRFENIMNFTYKSHISLWMIWVACLLKNLNHLICDRIKIVRILRRVSTFVNLRSRASQLLRKSLISLSKICSRCSMRNSEKRAYFRVKRTFLLENSSQINRELQSISNLQSIKSRRLVRT